MALGEEKGDRRFRECLTNTYPMHTASRGVVWPSCGIVCDHLPDLRGSLPWLSTQVMVGPALATNRLEESSGHATSGGWVVIGLFDTPSDPRSGYAYLIPYYRVLNGSSGDLSRRRFRKKQTDARRTFGQVN